MFITMEDRIKKKKKVIPTFYLTILINVIQTRNPDFLLELLDINSQLQEIKSEMLDMNAEFWLFSQNCEI